MGILSTFCIIALGVVTEKLLYPSADAVFRFWKDTPRLCEAGLGGFLLSGLSFYRQRSLLAWYYGQLCLYQAQEDGEQVNEILANSDAWYNWRWYQAGFGFLTLAFVQLGLAVTGTFMPFIVHHELQFGSLGIVIVGVSFGGRIYAYKKYPLDDRPIVSLWRRILRFGPKNQK